jgi:hypothetical protein
MTPRSKFKVIPPRPKALLTAKRAKPQPQNRSVEHRVYGIGNLLHVRALDDGSLVAVVTFNGVDRTIRLAPEYFITPIAEIMKLAPPPAPRAVKPKASAVPDDADADDRQADADADREIDHDEPDMVAEP